jgi:clan AA aspartic protease (TIGR02281 family)
MKKLITATLFLFFTLTFSFGQKIIKLNKESGVYTLPCEVNGVKMKFIYDTGASQVSISITEAMFLAKNGLLADKDVLGSSSFQDATGNISKGKVINLREINIDGVVLTNIKATVVDNISAPLLLGQNVLARLGRITFDPNSNTLTLMDIETKSEKFEKLIELGIIKQENNDYNGAISTLNEALELDSKDYRPYFYIAISKTMLGDLNGAVNYFDKAIILEPNYHFLYSGRGYAKNLSGQNYEALLDYNKSVTLNSTGDSNYYYRAIVKIDLEDFEGAFNDSDMAISLNLNPDDRNYFLRGYCNYMLGKYTLAINDFEKSITLNKIDGETYYWKGSCFGMLNNIEEACKDFKKALELGYEDAREMIQNNCK